MACDGCLCAVFLRRAAGSERVLPHQRHRQPQDRQHPDRWACPPLTHTPEDPGDDTSPPPVVLYNCAVGREDCSLCKHADAKYSCVWCPARRSCVYRELCQTPEPQQCPDPQIVDVSLRTTTHNLELNTTPNCRKSTQKGGAIKRYRCISR